MHQQMFVVAAGRHGAAATSNSPTAARRSRPATGDSTRPDITFSGNTPYVSWREDLGGGVEQGFDGHFVNAANPTFVLDESDVPLTPTAQADVREPISSACIATPFNQDGAACQGGAVGTPFFLFTNGTRPLACSPTPTSRKRRSPVASSGVGTSSATVAARSTREGAAVSVSFQFGTTTAYGQTTAAQTHGPERLRLAVQRRAVRAAGRHDDPLPGRRDAATSGRSSGADQTLRTASNPLPAPARRSTDTRRRRTPRWRATRRVCGCRARGGRTARCRLTLKLKAHQRVLVGSTHVSLKAGNVAVP